MVNRIYNYVGKETILNYRVSYSLDNHPTGPLNAMLEGLLVDKGEEKEGTWFFNRKKKGEIKLLIKVTVIEKFYIKLIF